MPSQPIQVSHQVDVLRRELDDAEAHLMMALAIDNTAKAEREAGPWRARVRDLREQIREVGAK